MAKYDKTRAWKEARELIAEHRTSLAIGLALRALNFAIPGRVENTVIGNLVLSWGGAWLLLDHSPNPGWLPWAVALGCLTHIAGDALTTAGMNPGESQG